MIDNSLITILIERYDKKNLDLSGVTIPTLITMQATFYKRHRDADARVMNDAIKERTAFTGKLV